MGCVKGHGLQGTVMRLVAGTAFHGRMHVLQRHHAVNAGLLDKRADDGTALRMAIHRHINNDDDGSNNVEEHEEDRRTVSDDSRLIYTTMHVK